MAKLSYNPTENLIREIKLGKDSFLYIIFPEGKTDTIHVLTCNTGDISADLIVSQLNCDNKLKVDVSEESNKKLRFTDKNGYRFSPPIEDQLSTFLTKGDKTFAVDAIFPYLSKQLREIVGYSVICDLIQDLDPEFKPQLMPVGRGYSIFISTKHDDKDVRKSKLKLIGREYHDDPIIEKKSEVPVIPIDTGETGENKDSNIVDIEIDDLDKLTVKNLKLLAVSEGIEIDKNWKKLDIIQAIRNDRLDKLTAPE